MCGRYTHLYTWREVHDFLSLGALYDPEIEKLLQPDYNVVPTREVPVARLDEERRLGLVPMRWAFLPSWSKEPKKYSINARAETVATTPMFRSAFKHRRCLIPASGWYEWQALPDGGPKQPWYFQPAEDPLLCFAGVWERSSEGRDTAAIITTCATELVASVHDRMPVIVPREQHDVWLRAGAEDAQKLLLGTSSSLRAHRVSRAVNAATQQGAALIEPA